MHKHILLASLAAFLASSTIATDPHPSPSPNSDTKPFACGTDTTHASDHFLSTISALHKGKDTGSPAARAAALSARDGDSASIDVVFHIVATTASKSAITNDMPSDQVSAMNKAYNPNGISFNLINVTWTVNDDWASAGAGDVDVEMKKSLRQGTYGTLNIYFQTDIAGGVLGRCTLPSNLTSNGKDSVDPSVYFNDGCNVLAHTMPKGSWEGYNTGMTAVHETGHWLGLLHTFEGESCEGPGDYIEDTVPEKEITQGCPTSPPKKTCEGKGAAEAADQAGSGGNGGLDPIHNYMDYSTDDCYTGFTPLQRERMLSMWGMYRKGM
ncbi:hypothetical protein BCR34DRAFT_495162 [Clohesyomyces aquaticus]|uniref:Peptidase M43 pregnancy-associated plasma-A domain-containing protein n=1 Tax=Clohesyomyces aquaticus TaxID=1231657 RepID=A0A1Y1YP81_9PLEO|nr:hypothetical protein BCR34DRAFT_495162 [Clohesyomyces aquaticus]